MLLSYGNIQLAGLIFFLYYGVPIFSVNPNHGGLMDLDDEATFKSMLFPLSSVGLGMKIARYGLVDAERSIGALVVLWSAQVSVSMVMDAVEAVVLHES